MKSAGNGSFPSIAGRSWDGNSRFQPMRVIRNSAVGVVVVRESGGRSLVFESVTGKIEVTDYPPEWQKLTDDELLLLSHPSP